MCVVFSSERSLSHANVSDLQAPVSLSSSLEEYLKDANFEANRLEYKQNREIAEGKKRESSIARFYNRLLSELSI